MDIPAFPDMQRLQLVKNTGLTEQRETIYMESRGMTLRDYFAAKAMQEQMRYLIGSAMHEHVLHDHIAMLAYRTADAMLRAREQS